MSRFDTKMPAPNAVAVSSTTTFKLPIGRRYHALSLVGSATAFAVDDLSEIRVIANEQVIQRYSGADRNAMNLFLGRDEAAISAARFDLVLPFDRYGLLNREAEEESALNTGSKDEAGRSINSLSIEIDINGTPTGTPRLEMYATQSEAIAGGPGLVPYIHKVTKDFASADTYDISDLPRGGVAHRFLEQVFMKPSASTLENLQVFANDVKLFERTIEQNERRQRDGVRVPQAGWVVIDKTEHGYGGDVFDLRGLNDWRIKLTAGAAMSLKLYTHYLGGLSD